MAGNEYSGCTALIAVMVINFTLIIAARTPLDGHTIDNAASVDSNGIDICSSQRLLHLGDDTLYIRSPNYRFNYNKSLHCHMTIDFGHRKLVELRLLEFNPEYIRDALSIYDEQSGSFSGAFRSGERVLTSNASTVTLRFSVNGLKRYVDFRLSLSATEVNDGSICSRPLVVTASPEWGDLWSPNFPSNYYENVDCTIVLEAPEDQERKVEVEILQFQTEECCDFLYLYDENSTNAREMYRLSGNSVSKSSFTSCRRKLTVRFRTDGSTGTRGFKLRFRSASTAHKDPECPDDENAVYHSSDLDYPSLSTIVGLEASALKGEFPYMLHLRFKGDDNRPVVCGAFLIAEQWALTVGSCFPSSENFRDVILLAGVVTRRGRQGDVMAVPRTNVFLNQGESELGGEMALILLPRRFKRNLPPVGLAVAGGLPKDGFATGLRWRPMIEGGLMSEQLMKVTLPLASEEVCQEVFHREINSKSMICAGVRERGGRIDSNSVAEKSMDAANASGLLVYNGVAVGFESRRFLGMQSSLVGVYARISAFCDWITEILCLHSSKSVFNCDSVNGLDSEGVIAASSFCG